ncbi:MAG: ribbon-helix-helix protein, CopG family [Gemmatimonadetes bacterium]|nr:ribbon-helix-helix protein, CopG family [Gemmatimonadota bacterium]
MTTILSVSLPDELRDALDAEAERRKRSRSFVVAEAVRQYIARQDRDVFRDARDQTLRENLALSPADRVRLSEELWNEFARGRPLTRPVAASFDTFEQYEQWQRRKQEVGA